MEKQESSSSSEGYPRKGGLVRLPSKGVTPSKSFVVQHDEESSQRWAAKQETVAQKAHHDEEFAAKRLLHLRNAHHAADGSHKKITDVDEAHMLLGDNYQAHFWDTSGAESIKDALGEGDRRDAERICALWTKETKFGKLMKKLRGGLRGEEMDEKADMGMNEHDAAEKLGVTDDQAGAVLSMAGRLMAKQQNHLHVHHYHAPKDATPEEELEFWYQVAKEHGCDLKEDTFMNKAPKDLDDAATVEWWSRRISLLSKPTSTLIEGGHPGPAEAFHKPPKGASEDQEVDYWTKKIQEHSLPLDQLIAKKEREEAEEQARLQKSQQQKPRPKSTRK